MINNTQISLVKLFIASAIFVLAFIIGGFYKIQIHKRISRKSNISTSTQTILANMGYYSIIVIAFFIPPSQIPLGLREPSILCEGGMNTT